jgi:hypothetical protein
MSTHQPQSASTASFDDFVASDFLALSSHMSACQAAGGKFLRVRFILDAIHALAAPRIVTSAAVVCTALFAVFMLA